MAETEFYPDVPTTPLQPAAAAQADLPARPDLEARVVELERVIATIATLREERFIGNDRPDPVALTAALYPRGMRSVRQTKRGAAATGGKGAIPLRFMLFDPSATG